jgi:K+-transporting ATPase c subunit
LIIVVQAIRAYGGPLDLRVVGANFFPEKSSGLLIVGVRRQAQARKLGSEKIGVRSFMFHKPTMKNERPDPNRAVREKCVLESSL